MTTTTIPDQPQDLTPTMQELMAQMAQMQAELNSLKERAQTLTLPQGGKPAGPQNGSTLPSSRRKALKRLALALLGGTAVVAAVRVPQAQAKIIVNPTLSNSTTNIGAIIIPPGVNAPGGTPPANINYGLVCLSDTTNFNLANLPNNGGLGVYGAGVFGYGTTTGVYGNGNTYGVYATGAFGVYGNGYSDGVIGTGSNIGVYGDGSNYGVYGSSSNGTGVFGTGVSTGVTGSTINGTGVFGYSSSKIGVSGSGMTGGAFGASSNIYGVMQTGAYVGVIGSAGIDVNLADFYSNTTTGVYGKAPLVAGSNAGLFVGNVLVTGSLTKSAGSFKIDHPVDPENKYLYHSFVESPDMMNIYNGNVTLDSQGEATVTLPDWFEALNSDYRYQLTCLGDFAPVFIAQKIKDRKFKIAGGQPGQEISWMVTGIRQDAWAKANRIPVEEDKKPEAKGKYLHPELFGQGEEKSVSPRSQKPGK